MLTEWLMKRAERKGKKISRRTEYNERANSERDL